MAMADSDTVIQIPVVGHCSNTASELPGSSPVALGILGVHALGL